MTSPRRSAWPASRWMGLSVLALLAAPDLARAAPVGLFYERVAVTAAGERCGLFTPETTAALAAATAQARGAALRAGAREATLAATEREARARGAQADCAAPATLAAAERVRDAFSGFARMTRLAYPGDMASWQADRTVAHEARWRLAQETRFGGDHLTFGLAGVDSPGVLLAMARFTDGVRPFSARLVLRDRSRSLGPYLDQGSATTVRGLALNRRLPPPSALKTFTAEARSPAGQDLLPKGATSGWAFRFPQAAAIALAELDPREAVAVEFLLQDGRVRRAYVEVGDFAAGRAFLQLARR